MASVKEWLDAVKVSFKVGDFIGPEGAKSYREQESMGKLSEQVRLAATEKNPEFYRDQNHGIDLLKNNLARTGHAVSADATGMDTIAKVAGQLQQCGVDLPQNANLADVGRAQTTCANKPAGHSAGR